MPKSKSRKKRHSSSYLHQEQRYVRNTKEIASQAYAGFALALHREFGWGEKRITRVLAATQKYWLSMTPEQIYKTCYEETGMMLVSEATAKELGIDIGEKI